MPKDKDTEKYFLEVTKWANGEGYDVYINGGNGIHRFQLTWGEYDALVDIFNKFQED